MRKTTRSCQGCLENVPARYRPFFDRYYCPDCNAKAERGEPVRVELEATEAVSVWAMGGEQRW